MRECWSCGARDEQAELPPRRKRGMPLLCNDCLAPPREARPGRKPTTRASYRAALRNRQGSPQRDLVDMIVKPP
jgi:hypothetical protein